MRVSLAVAGDEQNGYLQRVEAVRERPVSNIFLALAQVPALGDGVVAMAGALRGSTLLSRRLRELAIITVGIETKCRYELAHHWAVALKLGIGQPELEGVPIFETCPLFSAEDRAVIRYALQATRGIDVPQEVWAALEPLGQEARLELVLTVAWYNCVARIALPLRLDLEDWFRMPSIPEAAFGA